MVKCLLLSPLATGADAESFAEYTGAEFACVLWDARELYFKASRDRGRERHTGLFAGPSQPGDEQLWLVDKVAGVFDGDSDGIPGTRLYALGLLRFASAEALCQGESRLQRNFPRLYTKRIEEQQMLSIIREQNNCWSWSSLSARLEPRSDRGWDSSTDNSQAIINPGKLAKAEAARAVPVLTCTYDEHQEQSTLARLQELRREFPPGAGAEEIWYVGSPSNFERGWVTQGSAWGPELEKELEEFP